MTNTFCTPKATRIEPFQLPILLNVYPRLMSSMRKNEAFSRNMSEYHCSPLLAFVKPVFLTSRAKLGRLPALMSMLDVELAEAKSLKTQLPAEPWPLKPKSQFL